MEDEGGAEKNAQKKGKVAAPRISHGLEYSNKDSIRSRK
jgi:hypothetical protein